MNKTERVKMIKAMEFIARQINDEELFCDYWLTDGVADGDIPYGDTDGSDMSGDLAYYTEDVIFSDLMSLFLLCMKKAKKDGGLFCDGVVSNDNY